MNKNISIYKVIISKISNREVKVFEEIYIPVISVKQLSNFIDISIVEVEDGNTNFSNYRLKQLNWLSRKLKNSLKSEKFNYKGRELRLVFNQGRFCYACKGDGVTSFVECGACGGRGFHVQQILHYLNVGLIFSCSLSERYRPGQLY